jgi:hypothetical protein
MKRADELIAKVYEKSTHHQVDANAGQNDHHQKLGENRAEKFFKPLGWHVYVDNNNFFSIFYGIIFLSIYHPISKQLNI